MASQVHLWKCYSGLRLRIPSAARLEKLSTSDSSKLDSVVVDPTHAHGIQSSLPFDAKSATRHTNARQSSIRWRLQVHPAQLSSLANVLALGRPASALCIEERQVTPYAPTPKSATLPLVQIHRRPDIVAQDWTVVAVRLVIAILCTLLPFTSQRTLQRTRIAGPAHLFGLLTAVTGCMVALASDDDQLSFLTVYGMFFEGLYFLLMYTWMKFRKHSSMGWGHFNTIFVLGLSLDLIAAKFLFAATVDGNDGGGKPSTNAGLVQYFLLAFGLAVFVCAWFVNEWETRVRGLETSGPAEASAAEAV